MYEKFFGLEDEPFRLTADPHYLFLSPQHAEALAHLRLAMTESSGFVCITGEVGTGKTTLMHAFLAGLGPEVAALSTLTPPPSALELLRKLCRQFRLPVQDRGEVELVEALRGQLLSEHRGGRLCVLVIDEAQALRIELLEQIRLLLNIEIRREKLLRIVLLGQPELRTLLLDRRLAPLNQRITLRWHLRTLSYRDTAAYVAHRLAVASGGRGPQPFTRPALRLLHSVANGVPRVVNMIAHRAMLAAFLSRQPRVTRRLVSLAYREIQALPLPGTLSPLRKVAWATAGIAAGVTLVALAEPHLESFSDLALPGITQPAARPGDGGPGIEVTPSTERMAAPEAPVARPIATVSVPTRPAPVSSADLERRLASLDIQASARAATEAVLSAWGERSLAADEASLPDDLAPVAWRRGLDELVVTANRSMLRVLDLPAVLVLNVAGTPEPRYAALTSMNDSQVSLSLEGEPITVGSDVLERLWSGQAHVLWRDFDRLGTTLRRGVRDVAVLRLQDLLRRARAYSGEATGLFDPATESSVLGFQRAHLLEADGLVGPFTRIVLYASASGYPRPALAIQKGQAS